MGQIQDQFEKLIKKSINAYAKEYGVSKEKVQVQLYMTPVKDTPHTLEAGYKICVDYQPKKEVKVIDLIHPGKTFKIDFTGMSQLVHPFVAKIILELALENEIPPNKISVFCLLVTKGELEKIVLFLYNETNPVKRLDPAAVFNDEKIVI